MREDAIETIDMALGRILRQGRRGVALIAREVGDSRGIELSSWAFPILTELSRGPLRPSELAQRIGTSRPTMTRQLQQLEDKSLVCRERGEIDRRGIVLKLTERGIELARASRSTRRMELRRILEHWPAEQIDMFASLLSRLDHEIAFGPYSSGGLDSDDLED